MPFQLLLVLLLLPALAFVLVPYLWSNRKLDQQSRNENDTNLELYTARLKELEQELETERIALPEFDQLKDELGLSLLGDTRLQSSVKNEEMPLEKRAHVLLAVSSALIIFAFSWVMYAKIGAWPEVEIREAARVLEQQKIAPEKLRVLIQLLNDRLIDSPQNSNLLYLLGLSQMKQGAFRRSVSAFEKLRLLVAEDVNVDTSLAQARYMADDGKVSDANRQAMQDILKRAPHQPIILEILAIDAFQNRDGAAAIAYLKQGLAGGLRGERAESFRSGIKRAQEMTGGAVVFERPQKNVDSEIAQAGVNARIVIQVSIDPAIKAAPETAVFVFAREQGGMPMPLAVKRLSVGELPAEIVFSDADAMVQSRLLSQFSSIELVARLSYSGQPSLQPGDVEIRVGNVALAQLEAPVVLRLK